MYTIRYVRDEFLFYNIFLLPKIFDFEKLSYSLEVVEICAFDVCLSDVCLSDAYICPKSKRERPIKTKIGAEVAHVTSWTPLSRSKCQRSACRGGGIVWSPPVCASVRCMI